MELADLVGDVAEHQGNGIWVQRRAIGGNSLDCLAAGAKLVVESSQEAKNVQLGWVVIQDLVEQSPLPAGIDGRKDTEGAVVQLVGSQVAGKVGQGPVEVV